MRARLRYLALSPSTPRWVAQRVSELTVVLVTLAILAGLWQLPGLLMVGLGVTPAGAL